MVRFAPDGAYLVTAGHDGTLLCFAVPLAEGTPPPGALETAQELGDDADLSPVPDSPAAPGLSGMTLVLRPSLELHAATALSSVTPGLFMVCAAGRSRDNWSRGPCTADEPTFLELRHRAQQQQELSAYSALRARLKQSLAMVCGNRKSTLSTDGV